MSYHANDLISYHLVAAFSPSEYHFLMIYTKPLTIKSILHSFMLILMCASQAHAETSSIAPQVILLFGTSCAGKSTIARELQKDLGSGWKILDWDDYANAFGDDNAEEFLLNAITQELSEEHYLIIDTQPCMDFKNTFINHKVVSILIYAPLNTLISRDEIRQTALKRPEKRRRYARAYIYETFFQLYSFEPNNEPIDAIHSYEIEPEFFEYPLRDTTSNFFLQMTEGHSPVYIYAKKNFDLTLKTDQLDTPSALNLIKSKFFVTIQVPSVALTQWLA